MGDRASVATDLLRAGHAGLRDGGATSLPDYEIDLEPGWREDPAAVAAVAWRQDAARRTGLTHTLERLSYAWTPSNPVPAASPRLLFNEEPDDHRFLALFAETAQRSLDDLTRRTLAALGTEAQARDELEFYLGLPGERDWWRVGHTTAGDLVGFALPTRTASAASVGYLAVLPEHRGHGYVTDLLAEITRQHAHRGAPKITGTTDATNTPMAAAFDRGGYDRTGTAPAATGGLSCWWPQCDGSSGAVANCGPTSVRLASADGMGGCSLLSSADCEHGRRRLAALEHPLDHQAGV